MAASVRTWCSSGEAEVIQEMSPLYGSKTQTVALRLVQVACVWPKTAHQHGLNGKGFDASANANSYVALSHKLEMLPKNVTCLFVDCLQFSGSPPDISAQHAQFVPEDNGEKST